MPDVERGTLTEISPVPWQTCTAIGKRSWGYTKDNRFKSPYHVITDLIDIVSKNGRMLLNVGPKPDGTITKEETRVLQSLGDWLAVNGKGIYGTMPWRCYGEGKVRAKAGFFQDNKAKSTRLGTSALLIRTGGSTPFKCCRARTKRCGCAPFAPRRRIWTFAG